jgi:cystathionine beta-lyase
MKEDILICSDEIHNELLLGGALHVPMAGLRPEIAERTVTLIAPSKTFNIPGLFCAFALVPNQDLFERYQKTAERMVLHVNSLGLAGAQAAFSGACEDWLAELLEYLTANRDFLVRFVGSELPGIRVTVPDATYLAWLDCNALVRSGGMTDPPAKYFLEKARVALNPGADFGPGGEGFVRLNFGCPRSTLAKALDRMKTALKGIV